MENFDRENIDKLLEICQIHQYFPIKILHEWLLNLQNCAILSSSQFNNEFLKLRVIYCPKVHICSTSHTYIHAITTDKPF